MAKDLHRCGTRSVLSSMATVCLSMARLQPHWWRGAFTRPLFVLITAERAGRICA
jgi:hypothetical protein